MYIGSNEWPWWSRRGTELQEGARATSCRTVSPTTDRTAPCDACRAASPTNDETAPCDTGDEGSTVVRGRAEYQQCGTCFDGVRRRGTPVCVLGPQYGSASDRRCGREVVRTLATCSRRRVVRTHMGHYSTYARRAYVEMCRRRRGGDIFEVEGSDLRRGQRGGPPHLARRGACRIRHQMRPSGSRVRGHSGAPSSEGSACTLRRRRCVHDANRIDGARDAPGEHGEGAGVVCRRLRAT